MNNYFKFKLGMSTCAVVYVWTLPLLAKTRFTQVGSDSISAFIANPPATAAMAAVSFIPLTLVWEYQDIILENVPLVNTCTIGWMCNTLYYTTAIYQVSYGTFLICTYGYVKNWIHTITVISFSTSFIIHTLLTLTYSMPSKITKSILALGSSSCLMLIIMIIFNIHNLWFWFFESIGISCMFLFTPIEWIIINNNNHLNSSITGTYEQNNIANNDMEMKEGLLYNEYIDSHTVTYKGVFDNTLEIREELINRENRELEGEPRFPQTPSFS